MSAWFPDPDVQTHRKERRETRARLARLLSLQNQYDGKHCSKCGLETKDGHCRCGWVYDPPENHGPPKWTRKNSPTYGTAVCPGNRIYPCGESFVKKSPTQTHCRHEHTDAWARNHPNIKGLWSP